MNRCNNRSISRLNCLVAYCVSDRGRLIQVVVSSIGEIPYLAKARLQRRVNRVHLKADDVIFFLNSGCHAFQLPSMPLRSSSALIQQL